MKQLLLAEGIVIGLLLVLSGVLFYQLWKQHQILQFLLRKEKKENRIKSVVWKEEDERDLEMIKKRVDLVTLQNQINPHFLYNTLDSIRSKALLDGQKEIADMTQVLSKFFRYCISNSESLVRIEEELKHIGDYYYIQKYRFEDRIDMVVELESDEIQKYYIPKMSLQPLVENAFVHGLEKVSRKGLIRVKIQKTEDRILVTVSDNGAGMTIEQLDFMNERMNSMYIASSRRSGHNSIAVNNINARIKMTFGDSYGISYRSMIGEGTDAVVSIPIIDDFERVHYENKLESEVG
jgi:two-component system sensor histidine kinase YesM